MDHKFRQWIGSQSGYPLASPTEKVWMCVMGLLLCPGMVAWLVGPLPAQQNILAPVIFRIAYATYLGGRGAEQAREVIPYKDGSALVGGQTDSTDFPTTEGVVQPRYAGDDPALGHPGIYGGDCFLAHLSPNGRRLLAATYFGGSKQERNVYGMERDREGNIVLTTATRSPDLPTTDGCFQPHYGGGPADWGVAKLSPDLRRLLWCTYVGGSSDDFPRGGLALDEQDHVYVVGTTASPNFPTTPGALQQSRQGPREIQHRPQLLGAQQLGVRRHRLARQVRSDREQPDRVQRPEPPVPSRHLRRQRRPVGA